MNGIGASRTSFVHSVGMRVAPRTLSASPNPMPPQAAAQRPQPTPFLEPGPTNRLTLSLRSGIPSQVDWALALLVSYSQKLGDRLVLSDYPGLADVLMDFLRRVTAALRGATRAEWDRSDEEAPELTPSGFVLDAGVGPSAENHGSNLAAVSVAGAHCKRRRKASKPAHFSPHTVGVDAQLLRQSQESTLCLRNFCVNAKNVPVLLGLPDVLETIYDALRLTDCETDSAADREPQSERRECIPAVLDELSEHADLRVNSFDILEVLSPHIVLSDWTRQRFVDGTEAPVGSETLQDRVFAMLYRTLHATQDRALLLASLRCMSALAANEENSRIFVEVDPSSQITRLGLVQRCVALLPLTQDSELLEAAVDLLYQLVATGDNALILGRLSLGELFAERDRPAASEPTQAGNGQDLDQSVSQWVVTYLARNLSMGKTVWERDARIEANTSAAWDAHIPSLLRTQKRLEFERRKHPSAQEQAAGKRLRAHDYEAMRHLPEPDRGIAWYVVRVRRVSPQDESALRG